MGSYQVVDDVIPDSGCPVHLDDLGVAQGLADQATVEEARGEMAALYIGGTGPQQGQDFPLVTIDHPLAGAHHAALLALLYHLQVLPVRLWALLGGWPSPTGVLGHFPVDLYHGFPNAAQAIRNGRWGCVRVTAPLEGLEDLDARLGFRLGYPAGRA